MESFRKWLNKQELPAREACTDTGDIAHFARPVIPGFAYRRMYTDPILMDKEEEKRKKREGRNNV